MAVLVIMTLDQMCTAKSQTHECEAPKDSRITTDHMDQGVKETLGYHHHRSQDVNPL